MPVTYICQWYCRSSVLFQQLIGYVATATRPLSYRKITRRPTALDFNKYWGTGSKLWTTLTGFFLAVCSAWAHGSGESPWFFVQLSDPQLGFTSKGDDLTPDIEALDTVIGFINRVKPEFVIVTGDMTNRCGSQQQIEAYLATIARIDPSVPVYTVPGNHDIGSRHLDDSYDRYRRAYGDTRFVIDHRGTRVVGIDTSPIKNDDPAREAEQYAWLDRQLADGRHADHRIVMMHISPWYKKWDEDENSSNFPPAMRDKYHKLFKKRKVDAVYSGHLHNTGGGTKDGITYFTCGPVSRPLGTGYRGISVVTVYPDALYNNYVALANLEAYDPMSPGYNSYKGLVMAGYQGWFSAEGDGEGRGFHHYGRKKEGFRPGACTIDLWPDVSEYKKTYPTPFTMPDGTAARVFSPADRSTVDVHFRWMRDYGLDGVFMQRFVTNLKERKNLRHNNRVLDNAMQSASKYGRAICIMYDLSGMSSADTDVLINDIDSLASAYRLHRHAANPHYLYHNGKPLVAVWGAGFNDNRKYTTADVNTIVDALTQRGYSIMLGVPTYWREHGSDTENNGRLLHDVIRKCDIVMPWFVGRYDNRTYDSFKSIIPADMEWCRANGVDYAPLVFPGFSWKNMKGPETTQIDRESGRFLQRQIDGALHYGAEMLYVAMFDEIDEGTAIFKCAKIVPIPEKGTIFVPIDAEIDNDHYLRLVGDAARRIKKHSK